MIRFRQPPAASEPGQTSLVAGTNLEDALAVFGAQGDCLECETTIAAPSRTSDSVIALIRSTFTPLAREMTVERPGAATTDLLKRKGHWTEVDIDARAQRLRTVRMPAQLVGSQRLLAVNDLRGTAEPRPTLAIGLWAAFAHPVVRLGARMGGSNDGLTAEIALSVHPDRYVLIDSDRKQGLTFVLATPDIIVAELLGLALRAQRARFRGVGPWEDPLVQAATDLDLGARNAEAIKIDAIVSPTLSSQQQELAALALETAAELIGVSRSS